MSIYIPYTGIMGRNLEAIHKDLYAWRGAKVICLAR
jgi:hypothetical protein